MSAGGGERLRASRYLVLVDLPDGSCFCGHGVLGRRRVYDPKGAAIIRSFTSRAMTAEEAAAKAVAKGLVRAPGKGVVSFVGLLRDRGLLVPTAEDEKAAMAAHLAGTYGRDMERAFGLDAIEDAFEPALLESVDDLEAGGGAGAALEPLSVLLLGWCVAQAARPLLEAEARRRGLAARVEVGFPDDLRLISELRPDLTVLQLSHRKLLAPLLDGFHAAAPAEIESRLEAACADVRARIADACARAEGRLVVVQGVAAPQTSPLGAADVRHPTGFFEAVARLNRAARAEIAPRRSALFLDEEALLAREGKRRLLDDLVAPYSHHGIPGGDGSGERVPAETALHRLLARGWLDLYEAARGRRAVKLVVVDLDGTLWPGEVGDPEFSFDDERLTVPLMYGREGGLHQALRILEARGVLLAVASRNDRAEVLAKWRPERVPLALGASAEETSHYLRPEDFAALRISWSEPKSEMVRGLAAELGVALGAVAFIDDHPVEREEVRRALPEVWVLGDDMDAVREALLTSPRLEALEEPSEEARRRTETTRARLAREEAERRAPDRGEFLRSLGVRCRIRRERDGTRAARVSELLRRTTQLSTTGRRLSPEEVEALARRPGAALLTLEVADRFADYGLVGAALVEGPVIGAFVLSCRAIGLEAEVALLRRALLAAAEHGGGGAAVLRFTRTDRNLPATRLLAVPGFEPLADGSGYRFDLSRHPAPPDPEHCGVTEG